MIVMVEGSPWSAVASGLTSGLVCVVKICEFTYALKAVSEQTFAYLQTTEHVSENIKTARRLRRQSSSLLPADEKKDMDRVIRETETAVRSVAALLEPARVDREAEQKIRLTTRGLWVLRDNPNIAAALNRLQIAHHALNQVIGSLRTPKNADGLALAESTSKSPPPPAYEASQLLHWRMQSRLELRKGAGNAGKDEGLGIENVSCATTACEVPLTQYSAWPRQTTPAERPNDSWAGYANHDLHTSSASQSAPQIQNPFSEPFFSSAAQPWHHPPESFSTPHAQNSGHPDSAHSALEVVPQPYADIFAGLEVVDPKLLAPFTPPVEARSHKTWLSYQASRSGRRHRSGRHSLP